MPSLSQLQSWNADRVADIKAQIAAVEAKEASGQKAARSMSEEALRRRREREERRAAAARAKALAESVEESEIAAEPLVSSTSVEPATADRPSTPMNDIFNSNIPWTVTIPASSHADLPWYNAAHATYTTLEDAKAAGIWSYPSTLAERAKCGVFRGLWEQGCYMGGGIRFGGDFLVYPGKL